MKSSKYIAKKPDAKGYIKYSNEENETWGLLYNRQKEIIKNRACDEFLAGIDALKLSPDAIPQVPDVNKCLSLATGWTVEPVAALISEEKFFNLLANKKFPAATFIRTRDELEYLQEPDIFHELYGHCPLLTNKVYADFMQKYGEIGYKAEGNARKLLLRLYWFTVEFGLINTEAGLRIYGGGILSSIGETPYSVQSSEPQRKKFNIIDVLRTPYRIDIFQTIYYVIDKFNNLYDIVNEDLLSKVDEATKLGEFAPTFPPKD